ncbi:50S ribosomal protein L18 [Caldimicrobium thiodismutans]|jgi:large subunit ribosomal protein L18|uniref:Large ribosomal subunit protein uL18 n=1 Tax=Caldimicrobium thiodismutans TaxID=1653476 RepID=A0A0U4N435_9BACT|nr:50S ribosomal protein L18 [Caldimicrobium thiodismutans]BAU24054.1 50S ribosomal protein L18 [Caldimicrobium thiodismutans]
MRPEVKIEKRLRRKKRIRKKVLGTQERPRLAIFRSKKQIYAQVIDDLTGHTLIACSSLTPEVKEKLKELKEKGEVKNKVEAAFIVGKFLAEKAKAKGIEKVVFDRGGYKYHGRVKALAEGARSGGLEF